MRTKQVQRIAAGLAVAAVAMIGTMSQAQVLSKVQVQELAKKANAPAEHSQLQNHFAALADRYEAETKRYAAAAKAYVGNPNRRGTTGANHWTKLSESVAAMAKDARELATYHGQLAAGAPATHPADQSHLEHGAGAPTKMSDADLQRLVAGARTPAEHGLLKEYFDSLVAEYTQDIQMHTAMAAAYRANANRRGADPAVHCDRLVQQSRAAAAEAKALAAEHATQAK